MVHLSTRFLCLASLVATAAMPSFILEADARVVDLASRHHNKEHSGLHDTKKGMERQSSSTIIPLPPSAKSKLENSRHKGNKEGHKKDDKRVCYSLH